VSTRSVDDLVKAMGMTGTHPYFAHWTVAIVVILLGWIVSRIARYYLDRGIVRWPASGS